MATISPQSKMIVIPQKKAFELNMCYPLQQFIKQTYSSNLDDYLRSVDSLNQLRQEALFKSTRQDKLNKLMRYYDQLTAIESKLPISESQIRLAFKWQDALDRSSSLFGRSHLTLSSGLYERICVLFCVGASCSEVAGVQQLDTDDGLKQAAKLYQLAAGCFTFIRDSSLTTTRNDCTQDLYPETLACLCAIQLAQAQEVFYFKAIKDKMREQIISKLAAQTSDLYADAMKSIQASDSLKDLQKQLLPILAGKQALYHGLAEYYKAEQASIDKNIGESIARLAKSAEILKVAESRGSKDLNSIVKKHSQQVEAALVKAKKENDYVYHERVPEYSSLPQIERAQIAKVTQVKLPISGEGNFRDLFATLVPVTVHNGLAQFKSRKQESFNLEIGKLRQASDLLNTALSAWNLPAAIEDVGGANGGNNVPQSLLAKSQAIRDKGGFMKIDSMMTELPPLLSRNTELLNEAKRCLHDEERSDTDLRQQMRDKWTRTPSRSLTGYLHSEIGQYETIIENAIKANKVIETKYGSSKDSIQLLSRSPQDIAQSLPAATPAGALQRTHVVKDLRRLMDEVEALRNVREVLESEMKQSESQSDGVQAKLVSALQNSQGLDEHAIIEQEVDSLVTPMRKQVRENIQEQERLLGFIEKAHSEFSKELVHNETSKMREQMLKNLAVAADSYNELYNHLIEGTKFYNDLTPILMKYQNKVNDFVFARKTEKDDLMKEIQTNLTRAPSQTSSSGGPPPARPPPPSGSSSSINSSGYPAPPPESVQYQPPSSTAASAGGVPSPYYPMMPNVYNPYSTYPGPAPPGQQHPQQQQGGAPGGSAPSYPNQYPPHYPRQ